MMKNLQHDTVLIRSLKARLEQARLVQQNLQIRMAEIEAEILEIIASLRKAKGEEEDDLTFFWDDEF